MNKIKTIYLDMDGVLADFEKRFNELSDKGLDFYKSSDVIKAEFDSVKKNMIREHGLFENLPLYDGAEYLVNELIKITTQKNIVLEVLTAVGDYESDLSVVQKKIWLSRHFPQLKFGYCIKSHDKAKWAAAHTLLIDDREKCLVPFKERGGTVIKHISAENTIQELINILEEVKKEG